MRSGLILCWTAACLLLSASGAHNAGQEKTEGFHGISAMVESKNKAGHAAGGSGGCITLFLCGDVMTGRGIDQVLPHPSAPEIYEPYMRSARGYVDIAEKANGPIDEPVGFSYVWGDALEAMDRMAPDVRIINLETSVTRSNAYWKGKGIHYRMHPENIPLLTTAGIDVCTLANNHVLDWGYAGLIETLETIETAGIQTAGAGRTLPEAADPAVTAAPGKGRVIVFAFGSQTSGIPRSWGAEPAKPGVNLLTGLNEESLGDIRQKVAQVKRRGDVVVASIHWGSNWGHHIPRAQTVFAHGLIDAAGVDIVYGHSSHHVRAIEVYKDKLILYGCGDFINDYEGIGGHEEFRGDLALMYFATVDPSSGKLLELQMTPTQIRRFKVIRAAAADAHWLQNTLNREGTAFGTQVEMAEGNRLKLQWD